MRHRLILCAVFALIIYAIVRNLPDAIQATADMFR
jgi:hypothetical protein